MALRLGSVLRESSPRPDVRIVALSYPAGSLLDPHRHEELYTSILAQGRYTEICAAMPRRCEVGTVIAHGAREEHADYFQTDGVCVNVYRADRSIGSDRALSDAFATHRPCDWRDAFDRVERLMRSVFDDVESAVPAPPSWLDQVLTEFNWTSSASLRTAADAGGIHPAHLARAFRAHVGLTPSAYRRRARIIAASAQLLSSSAPLAEIAADAGFYDQSDFTHRFFEASGLTPGRFRSLFRR